MNENYKCALLLIGLGLVFAALAVATPGWWGRSAGAGYPTAGPLGWVAAGCFVLGLLALFGVGVDPPDAGGPRS